MADIVKLGIKKPPNHGGFFIPNLTISATGYTIRPIAEHFLDWLVPRKPGIGYSPYPWGLFYFLDFRQVSRYNEFERRVSEAEDIPVGLAACASRSRRSPKPRGTFENPDREIFYFTSVMMPRFVVV